LLNFLHVQLTQKVKLDAEIAIVAELEPVVALKPEHVFAEENVDNVLACALLPLDLAALNVLENVVNVPVCLHANVLAVKDVRAEDKLLANTLHDHALVLVERARLDHFRNVLLDLEKDVDSMDQVAVDIKNFVCHHTTQLGIVEIEKSEKPALLAIDKVIHHFLHQHDEIDNLAYIHRSNHIRAILVEVCATVGTVEAAKELVLDAVRLGQKDARGRRQLEPDARVDVFLCQLGGTLHQSDERLVILAQCASLLDAHVNLVENRLSSGRAHFAVNVAHSIVVQVLFEHGRHGLDVFAQELRAGPSGLGVGNQGWLRGGSQGRLGVGNPGRLGGGNQGRLGVGNQGRLGGGSQGRLGGGSQGGLGAGSQGRLGAGSQGGLGSQGVLGRH
jgi:hypothetical protein